MHRYKNITVVFFAALLMLLLYAGNAYAKKFTSDGAYISYYNNSVSHDKENFIKNSSMSSTSSIADWEFFINPFNNSSSFFKQPTGIWLTGRTDDFSVLSKTILLSKETIPIYVIYFSPTQNHKTASEKEIYDYLSRNIKIAKTIGNKKSIIILEPDLLCLSSDSYTLLKTNQKILSNLVKIYKQYANNSRVYLDAGHSNWHNPGKMSQLLKSAGIELADGFSTNVSNFQYTNNEVEYATKLSKLVGNKSFVIDTGRNGNGPGKSRNGAPIWSDPIGIRIGEKPTTRTEIAGLDALLWIKPPGEADGSAAPAGTWLPILISFN